MSLTIDEQVVRKIRSVLHAATQAATDAAHAALEAARVAHETAERRFGYLTAAFLQTLSRFPEAKKAIDTAYREFVRRYDGPEAADALI